MKVNTAKNIMKGVGGALAVCSVLAMVSSSKPASSTTKKAVKKTASKVAGMVDAISAFM